MSYACQYVTEYDGPIANLMSILASIDPSSAMFCLINHVLKSSLCCSRIKFSDLVSLFPKQSSLRCFSAYSATISSYCNTLESTFRTNSYPSSLNLFFHIIPFPRNLPSYQDTGTPIGSILVM